MKLKDAYKIAQDYLKKQDIGSYLSDVRFLLTEYLKCDMSYITLNPDKEIDYPEFEKLLKKRAEGMPCAYITGNTEFMGLKFFVNENVLIPRQDTEVLVESVMKFVKSENKSILDICTGSGCIAVSLKKFCKNAEISALDISEEALKIADKNAKENDAEINFFKCDILKAEKLEKYDIIVSNPPYIETEVVKGLDKTVKDYEPHLALDGGEDGLVFYRKITYLSKESLNDGGKLFFEIGYNQGESLKEILIQNGFNNIKIIKDYAGNDRVAVGDL